MARLAVVASDPPLVALQALYTYIYICIQITAQLFCPYLNLNSHSYVLLLHSCNLFSRMVTSERSLHTYSCLLRAQIPSSQLIQQRYLLVLITPGLVVVQHSQNTIISQLNTTLKLYKLVVYGKMSDCK